MKLTRTVQLNPLLVSIVPLVNVVFLLLAFFSLNSTFALQPGIAVALPVSSFVMAPQQNPQIISITSGLTAAFYYKDLKLDLEQLAVRLGADARKQQTVIIRADRGTPYETVVQVMNLALGNGYSVVLATAEPAANAAR